MLNHYRSRLYHKRFKNHKHSICTSNLKYFLFKRMLPTSHQFEADQIFPKYLCSKPEVGKELEIGGQTEISYPSKILVFIDTFEKLKFGSKSSN